MPDTRPVVHEPGPAESRSACRCSPGAARTRAGEGVRVFSTSGQQRDLCSRGRSGRSAFAAGPEPDGAMARAGVLLTDRGAISWWQACGVPSQRAIPHPPRVASYSVEDQALLRKRVIHDLGQGPRKPMTIRWSKPSSDRPTRVGPDAQAGPFRAVAINGLLHPIWPALQSGAQAETPLPENLIRLATFIAGAEPHCLRAKGPGSRRGP